MIRRLLTAVLAAAPLLVAAQPLRLDKGNTLQQVKFMKFFDFLTASYVDSLDNSHLIETAITSILSELDPHSSYSSPEEMKAINESFEGSFSGIGIEFDVLKDTIIVVNTIAGGPAEKVGIRANDRIVNVDGVSAIGSTRADVPRLLRGKRGSKVALDIRRDSGENVSFTVTRDDIPLHTVDAAYLAAPEIGYIKVNRFAHNTMSEFLDAYRRIGSPESLILDLRGNGGGLLEQAILLSEFFLPEGALIVSTEGRSVATHNYRSAGNTAFGNGKVVVLIDHASASGSEIVAGAIQDWDRGIIIGRQSFGKGLVQQQVPLPDGSAVRITVARYHTPSGRVIQRPFEQGNRQDYYLDLARRSTDDAYADSMRRSAPSYKTLRTGRTVTGGGGITPDIVIQTDTNAFSTYLLRLVNQGIINEYVLSYFDRNRNSLAAQYDDINDYIERFAVTQPMLDELADAADAHGIEYDEAGMATSREWIEDYMRALIAMKLYGTEGYYRVINQGPQALDYKRAVEVLSDWEHLGEPLLMP